MARVSISVPAFYGRPVKSDESCLCVIFFFTCQIDVEIDEKNFKKFVRRLVINIALSIA